MKTFKLNDKEITYDEIRQMNDEQLEDFLSEVRTEALEDGAYYHSLSLISY